MQINRATGQPELVVNQGGLAQIRTARGLTVNSVLRNDEWKSLDDAIIRRVHDELTITPRLRARGLVRTLGGLGTIVTQWNVAGEKPMSIAVMDPRTSPPRDRVEKKLAGVPVPIIHSEYTFGERELASMRLMGNDLETLEAEEAAASVVEKFEDMIWNGEPTINVGGATIPGILTYAGRLTDTASNFGGGDFGTVSNIYPTFTGVLGALAARRYRGPFGVFVASEQYYQLLAHYSDGSGQTGLVRISQLPQIEFIEEAPQLAAGTVVFLQLSANVIDLAIALDLQNREWVTGDGTSLFFRVLMAGVHRIKSDYAGYTGIAHVTGA